MLGSQRSLLLIAFENMESWTDEIASMRRDNPIAE